MKVFALVLLSAGAAGAQTTAPVMAPLPPSPGFPPCNVCNANDPTVRVTNNDVIVEIEGQNPTSCLNFQRAGDFGFIEEFACPAVVGFLSGCGCMVQATAAPVVVATAAPVMAPLPPSPGFPPCNVCSANDPTIRVTNNDFIVEIDGQEPTSCFNFQRAGDFGFIEESFCPAVVGFLAGCECMAQATAAPVVPTTPAPVTPAPVTPAPVTAAPVMAPLPPSPGFPPCNVCSANDPTIRVTNNDFIVEIDGQEPTTCFNFQRAGDFGFIEEAFCPAVVGFLAGCECMAPATAAPVTAAPVTSAPVTPAPVTPAPVTAAPVVPATAAPVTPAPVTAAPVTPAPVTPAPVTAAPVTPAPVTPAPVTPAPVTPAPVTAAPVTPAPVTPAPVTPAPVTAAPVTPAPVTPAPVVPVTPAPVTQAPAEAPAGTPVMAPVMKDKKSKNKMKGNKGKKMPDDDDSDDEEEDDKDDDDDDKKGKKSKKGKRRN